MREFCTADDLQRAEQQLNTFTSDAKNADFFNQNRKASIGVNFLRTKATLLTSTFPNDVARCRQSYFLLRTLERLQNKSEQAPLLSINNPSSNLMGRDQAFGNLAEYYIKSRISKLVQDGILDSQDIARLN